MNEKGFQSQFYIDKPYGAFRYIKPERYQEWTGISDIKHLEIKKPYRFSSFNDMIYTYDNDEEERFDFGPKPEAFKIDLLQRINRGKQVPIYVPPVTSGTYAMNLATYPTRVCKISYGGGTYTVQVGAFSEVSINSFGVWALSLWSVNNILLSKDYTYNATLRIYPGAGVYYDNGLVMAIEGAINNSGIAPTTYSAYSALPWTTASVTQNIPDDWVFGGSYLDISIGSIVNECLASPSWYTGANIALRFRHYNTAPPNHSTYIQEINSPPSFIQPVLTVSKV